MNNIPGTKGLSKKEIVDTLLREEYGYLPSRPTSVSATVIERDERFVAGKAVMTKISLNCKADFGEFSFPVYCVCPKSANPSPAFIHINFRDLVPDVYQPIEEIVDLGYGVLTVCYEDVSTDDGDFTNGLAGVVYPDGKRGDTDCGKIGLWAWAVMAVMDYAVTLPEIDASRISVVGHSRLGKTALLAGALDERFYCAFSNDSGCCGASLSRNNTGENIHQIYKTFPFWFIPGFEKYAHNEDALPFDQHWLIAANVPHKVYVASAKEDSWACPENEYAACVLASEYYEDVGLVGFVRESDTLTDGALCHAGNIGYHIREGIHYLSRRDWQLYIKYLNF